jgi:hypothetical protein
LCKILSALDLYVNSSFKITYKNVAISLRSEVIGLLASRQVQK